MESSSRPELYPVIPSEESSTPPTPAQVQEMAAMTLAMTAKKRAEEDEEARRKAEKEKVNTKVHGVKLGVDVNTELNDLFLEVEMAARKEEEEIQRKEDTRKKIKSKFQIPGSKIVLYEELDDLFYTTNSTLRFGPAFSATLKQYALDFAWVPVPLGTSLSCRVTKFRKRMDLFPTYFLYLERPGISEVLLLTAKQSSIFGDIIITTNPEELSKTSNYCAGILENLSFLGSHLLKRPAHKPYPFLGGKKKEWVDFLGIKIRQKSKTFDNPRPSVRVKVAAPRLESDANQYKPGSAHFHPCNEKDTSQVLILRNRVPAFNRATRKHEPPFQPTYSNGFVPNAKHFELAYKDKDIDLSCLKFRRFGRAEEKSDSYLLNFSYPFCPLQAFGVALSTFDL